MSFYPLGYFCGLFRKYFYEIILITFAVTILSALFFIYYSWTTSSAAVLNDMYNAYDVYNKGNYQLIEDFNSQQRQQQSIRTNTLESDLLAVRNSMDFNRKASKNLIAVSAQRAMKNFVSTDTFQLSKLKDFEGFQENLEPLDHLKSKTKKLRKFAGHHGLQMDVHELLEFSKRTNRRKFLFTAFVQEIDNINDSNVDTGETTKTRAGETTNTRAGETTNVENFQCSSVSNNSKSSFVPETNHYFSIYNHGHKDKRKLSGERACYGILDHEKSVLFVACLFDISKFIDSNDTDHSNLFMKVFTTPTNSTPTNSNASSLLFWSNFSVSIADFGVFPASTGIELFVDLADESTAWSPDSKNKDNTEDNTEDNKDNEDVDFEELLRDNFADITSHDGSATIFENSSFYENLASTKINLDVSDVSNEKNTENSLFSKKLQRVGAIKNKTSGNILLPSGNHLKLSSKHGFTVTLKLETKELLNSLEYDTNNTYDTKATNETTTTTNETTTTTNETTTSSADVTIATTEHYEDNSTTCPTNVGARGNFGTVIYVMRGNTKINTKKTTHADGHTNLTSTTSENSQENSTIESSLVTDVVEPFIGDTSQTYKNLPQFMLDSLRSSVLFALAASVTSGTSDTSDTSKNNKKTIKFSALSGKYGIHGPTFYVTPGSQESFTLSFVCAENSNDLLVYFNGQAVTMDDRFSMRSNFFSNYGDSPLHTTEPGQLLKNLCSRCIIHSRGNLTLSEIQSIHETSTGPGTYLGTTSGHFLNVRGFNRNKNKNKNEDESDNDESDESDIDDKCQFIDFIQLQEPTAQDITKIETEIVQPFLDRDINVEVTKMTETKELTRIDLMDSQNVRKAQKLMLSMRDRVSKIREQVRDVIANIEHQRSLKRKSGKGDKDESGQSTSTSTSKTCFTDLIKETKSTDHVYINYSQEQILLFINTWFQQLKYELIISGTIRALFEQTGKLFLSPLEKRRLGLANYYLILFMGLFVQKILEEYFWMYKSQLEKMEMASFEEKLVKERIKVLDDRVHDSPHFYG